MNKLTYIYNSLPKHGVLELMYAYPDTWEQKYKHAPKQYAGTQETDVIKKYQHKVTSPLQNLINQFGEN